MFDSAGRTGPSALGKATVAIAVLASWGLAAQPAAGVIRTCGADALSNTTNVLCASPSGPCTSTTVTVSSPLEVQSGACAFDLGGRALVVDRIFDIVGTGYIKIFNAGDVTVTDSGKLRARGDYQSSPIGPGGTISVDSTGAISFDGVIDVGGDPSGSISLKAVGTITLETGSLIRGVGTSSFVDDGARFADGGSLDLVSTGGSIEVNGDIVLNGENAAQGGDAYLQAARNIVVTQPIEAAAGGDGGSVDMAAGDDITIAKYVDVDSRLSGGIGGDISVAAGEDSLGGVITGGALTISNGAMKLNGSSGDGYGGDGGDFRARAMGPMLLTSTASVKVDAGSGFDGTGGSIFLRTGDTDMSAVGALDGDLTLQGVVKGRSGDGGGWGGDLVVSAGRDLDIDALVDLGGREGGGTVLSEAGRNFELTSTVNANATTSEGNGGVVWVQACDVSLAASGDILATGEWGGSVELVGRQHVAVDANSSVDASGWWGGILLVTKTFGTCSNDPTRDCRSNADCIIGCGVGTCQNVNPDTGGTTTQFSPPPDFIEDPTLTSCQ
jgi:hypothetical protein